jgi:hypothetical protein
MRRWGRQGCAQRTANQAGCAREGKRDGLARTHGSKRTLPRMNHRSASGETFHRCGDRAPRCAYAGRWHSVMTKRAANEERSRGAYSMRTVAKWMLMGALCACSAPHPASDAGGDASGVDGVASDRASVDATLVDRSTSEDAASSSDGSAFDALEPRDAVDAGEDGAQDGAQDGADAVALDVSEDAASDVSSMSDAAGDAASDALEDVLSEPRGDSATCSGAGGGCLGTPCCAGLECSAIRVCQAPAACASGAQSCFGLPCCGGLECRMGRCAQPCRAEGASCGGLAAGACCSGLSCVSGTCRACAAMSAPCGAGSLACCGGLECNAGRCVEPCRGAGATCSTTAPCCSGLACNGATNRCEACVANGERCTVGGAPCCDGRSCTTIGIGRVCL